MDMTHIAERALAAQSALTELAAAVAKMPPPHFKFFRSIELLGRLAGWAHPRRGREGFADALKLSRALETGLKEGCAGRKAPRRRAAGRPALKKEAPVEITEKEVVQEIATIWGRVGGWSRSKEKIAAARANMLAINEKRYGPGGRRKQTGR